MEYAIGLALALLLSCFARLTGLDRDRAFYPAVTIAIASYYVLFAVMGASSPSVLVVEAIAMAAFVLVAALGFRFSLWLVVAGLAGHGVFDVLHPHAVANPGVPEFWPAFCATFDVAAAAFLAWLLLSSKVHARGAAR